ncbi:MAG: hypothetical protein M3Q30_12295 [Actinomycetota bacterium]|nr:hypothetical protein [Actinomycetota bacterium]
MVDLTRVRELESQRRALALDAKTLMRRAVSGGRRLTPEENVHLHELRQQHDRVEHEIQALFDERHNCIDPRSP